MKRTNRHERGFTLIELMITVVVIGILGAIAYPAYTDQVRKGRRADARGQLMALLQQQERVMTQRNTYAEFTTTENSATFKNYLGTARSGSSHVFGARKCQPIPPSTTQPDLKDCIEVFAQPNTGYSDPGVTEMAADSLGRRTCTGTQQTRCWQ